MMMNSLRMMSLVRGSTANSRISGRIAAAAHHRTFVSRSAAVRQDDSLLPYHLVVGLPALSPTMEQGVLAEWYVSEGSSFSAGDALAKIETDKASMDFEAQDDGYVAKILIQPGGNDLKIGTPIMVTVEEEADVAAFKDYTPPAAAAASAEQTTAAEPEAPPPPPAKAVAKETAEQPPASPPPPSPAARRTVEAPTVPPVVVAPPTEAAFLTAWGLSVVNTSPLAKTLAAQQKDYIAKYGTTGQAPILNKAAAKQ